MDSGILDSAPGAFEKKKQFLDVIEIYPLTPLQPYYAIPVFSFNA